MSKLIKVAFGLYLVTAFVSLPRLMQVAFAILFWSLLLALIVVYIVVCIVAWRTGVRVSNPYDEFRKQMKNKADEARRATDRQRAFRDAWAEAFGVDYDDYAGFRRAYGTTAAPKRPAKPAWCNVLGLPQNATKDQIKAQYRRLAKTTHPDAGGSATAFSRLQKAYEEAMR